MALLIWAIVIMSTTRTLYIPKDMDTDPWDSDVTEITRSGPK